jgi:hypothetical protein
MYKEPQEPSVPYSRTNPEWQRYAYELAATYNLHRKHIAAKLGLNFNTLDTHHEMILAINKGWADFAKMTMGELLRFALDEPTNYDDPIERNQIRAQKLDATKTISKIVEKREEVAAVAHEGDKNREALKALPLDVLQAELRKFIKT